MGQECTFILPNGQKCRCIACRNQDRCRHHAPKPSAATPRPLPKHLLFSRHRRWSSLGREIPTMHPTQAPTDIYDILLALLTDGEQGISDREAGRLLRGLLRLLGSVPFPAPAPPEVLADGVEIPEFDPEALAGRKYDPDLLNALLASLGVPERVPTSMRPDPYQPRPSWLQPQPSPPQTRPNLNQMQPSYK